MGQRDGLIEGINITPLVDICLVLLIIFIVTAKMVVQPAVPLDLPVAKGGEELQTIFAVTLPEDGSILVDGAKVAEGDLLAHAKDALARTPDLRAVIQADGDVPHRHVIGVLDRLKEAGIVRVAFGTAWPDEGVAGAAN